jgi:hypothetical protein
LHILGILFSHPLSVSQLAELIDESAVAVIKLLMTDLGVMASMSQSLDPATCMAVIEAFGMVIGGADDMDEEWCVYIKSSSSVFVFASRAHLFLSCEL